MHHVSTLLHLIVSQSSASVAPMPEKTSYTYKLTQAQQDQVEALLRAGNYRPVTVPYARVAVKTENCNINLYTSGKLLVQGKGAEEFVLYVLEPLVLQAAGVGYEETLNPEASQPHMGIDESGKGDFFGPMVIVSAYVDAGLVERMRAMGVKDSKQITSDAKALGMGSQLRKLLGSRFGVVKIGPGSYNRLYAKMRNVNRMLSWGHARAIENLLDKVPECPRAISDQFGKKEQVERALMQKGRQIELVQMHKAESDMAVAAASVIARELFIRSLKDLEQKYELDIPKGASAAVRTAAEALVKKCGPEILLEACKCHFKTADQVLAAVGKDRSVLGPEGQATSKPMGNRWVKKK